MKIADNEYLALETTGRRVYAYGGILGLRVDGSDLTVNYGYDGIVTEASDLTGEERKEMADAMIAAWTRFREAFSSKAWI